ncbi:DUF4230 domain-containing protein [Fulvivirga sediminis]|uniref:DUF4230 domain-containing protein n=1 Tax=Fulvivirga sediminis TaxID=2803949 RepID=A0A937JZ49_9BACT|nr:DUF4230 domain-containing protein [Fulvivirga sediminis]MBL3654910.1 DUF4230 domain-containing protein [Fulvivirga sediminis]
MRVLRLLTFVLPWFLVLLLGSWLYFDSLTEEEPKTIINNSTMLEKVEALGKMELVRYNFKEITELKELSKEYFRLFKLGPDSKIALISAGHAVGCIDLTKVKVNDILVAKDTIYLRLPEPEICYYKLDMENTRIYDMQTNPLKDQKAFIQKAYKNAEREIKTAAENSGILEQTRANAELIMKPMLEEMSGKVVILTDDIPAARVELY